VSPPLRLLTCICLCHLATWPFLLANRTLFFARRTHAHHGGIRYRFPAGIFEIDEQLLIPEWTFIHGAADPNDMANPTKSPEWRKQTLFLATRGATDWLTTYCFAEDMVRGLCCVGGAGRRGGRRRAEGEKDDDGELRKADLMCRSRRTRCHLTT
jgi:hypothetical protein